MQTVSSLYRQLISDPSHWFETSVVLNGVRYTEAQLISLSTSHTLFDTQPGVGNCISGEISVELLAPGSDIPTMATVIPCVRATTGTQYSEWLQKGFYFIDTREATKNDDNLQVLSIHGFDAMLKAEADYPSGGTYPMLDKNVVSRIAATMGITVDSRTLAEMTKGYQLELPVGYSMREVLSYIGSMYCGNFIINDAGQLRLIGLNSIPPETNYLIDNSGFAITFGENPNEVVRILVN